MLVLFGLLTFQTVFMVKLEEGELGLERLATQQTQNVPLTLPNGPVRLFFGEPNKNVIRTFHVGYF